MKTIKYFQMFMLYFLFIFISFHLGKNIKFILNLNCINFNNVNVIHQYLSTYLFLVSKNKIIFLFVNFKRKKALQITGTKYLKVKH